MRPNDPAQCQHHGGTVHGLRHSRVGMSCDLEEKREKRKQTLIRDGVAMSSIKKRLRKRAKDEIKRREEGR